MFCLRIECKFNLFFIRRLEHMLIQVLFDIQFRCFRLDFNHRFQVSVQYLMRICRKRRVESKINGTFLNFIKFQARTFLIQFAIEFFMKKSSKLITKRRIFRYY